MLLSNQNVLAILKSELEYLETGGYGPPVRDPASATSTMFADSQICLNYGYPYRIHACAKCPLIKFVPPNKRTSAMPCHEILLDATGRTVERFVQSEDQQDMQETVKGWLRNAIQHLESEGSSPASAE